MENTEIKKKYEENELLESTIINTDGWNLVKSKETPKSSNPEDIEIYNMYYNSEFNKAIKIRKNPYTKFSTIENVDVKDLNSSPKSK